MKKKERKAIHETWEVRPHGLPSPRFIVGGIAVMVQRSPVITHLLCVVTALLGIVGRLRVSLVLVSALVSVCVPVIVGGC